MAKELKSKLWVFLNSNFGLFMMSSIVVSFITWSYTQWTDSLEKEKVLSEKLTKLETEFSYRVQVMQNYFESECVDHDQIGRKTVDDIDQIYRAAPSYQAIFPENAEKDLHMIIWELSAVQKEDAKHLYISCFDSLLKFNTELNRLQTQVDPRGFMYEERVNYIEKVAMLTAKFTSAIKLVNPEFSVKTNSPRKAVPAQGASQTEKEPIDSAQGNTVNQTSAKKEPMNRVSLAVRAIRKYLPTPEPDINKPFLMPIQDVHENRAQSGVVSGTIERGIIKTGDEVEVLGLGVKKRSVVLGIEIFEKPPDFGEAGDNVGLLLEGVGKDELQRGMVIAEPGSIKPYKNFKAEVYMLSVEEGGRNMPFVNGYRPQIQFRVTEVTGLITLPGGIDKVMPGERADVEVELTSPIAMEKGLRFAVREGGLAVGAGVVTELEVGAH